MLLPNRWTSGFKRIICSWLCSHATAASLVTPAGIGVIWVKSERFDMLLLVAPRLARSGKETPEEECSVIYIV